MSNQKSTVVSSWETFHNRTTRTVKYGKRIYEVQNLSGEEWEKISAIPMPEAPMNKPVLDNTGRPLIVNGKAQYEPDLQDEDYLQKMEKASQRRTVKILQHGMVQPDGMQIPGETDEEKWKFLSKGNLGDILKLTNIIVQEMTNLQPDEVDFLSGS